MINEYVFLIGTCYDALTGIGYTGTLSTTKSGKTCQRWDATTPHYPSSRARDPDNFPEKSLSGAENYCRNPTGSQQPWCYTTDNTTRWDWCNAPACKGTITIGSTFEL